ncbi:MAG: PhzF family phenazine biosynthesis protein [Anaerolineae bacterium]|nr:PhzF family phenazine biosynthesis protein [Anaerolineae bacterium]
MPKQHTYHLLDVFTSSPFGGNQLAVFPDADTIPSELMQIIANELNLSETVFVLPADQQGCDYRMRIFTPRMELPMAGHPTVGTGYLLAHLGKVRMGNGPISLTMQQNVGPIGITIYPEEPWRVAMRQPKPQFGETLSNDGQIAALLGLSVDDLADYPRQVVSTGVPFLFVPLKSLDAAHRIQFNGDVWKQHFNERHIYTFTMETELPGSTVHSRMFAPAMGIAEDPATGAASGPLGAYLLTYGLVNDSHIINEQGVEMGRPSVITIQIDDHADNITGVEISGTSVYMGQGTLHLP